MFRNTYQKGFLSILSSTGSKPLSIWSSCVRNGHIKRLTDQEICSLVLELIGCNVATTFICAPRPGYCSLAIKLPFIILIVKNLKKYFTFEIQVLDDRHQLRRFRVSNYQTTTRIKPFCTSMPLCLSPGWNQIQFNLADFVRRAYQTNYVETVRIQIHANVRVRRVYFTDRLYSDEEKPVEYRLFRPERPQKSPRKFMKLSQLMHSKESEKKVDEDEEEIHDSVRPGTPAEGDTEIVLRAQFVSGGPDYSETEAEETQNEGGETQDEEPEKVEVEVLASVTEFNDQDGPNVLEMSENE